MKYIFFGFLLLIITVISCTRKTTDYLSFLDGKEITYPGTVQNVSVFPGKNRLRLSWHPSSDPSISKYVVYWNNYADSLTVPASKHDPADTISCLVSGLQEYSYTFFINAYDEDGNKSITTEVDNARVYGAIYQTNLLNRPVNADTPFIVSEDGQDVLLKFIAPDTININTTIHYTTSANTKQEVNLSPDQPDILIKDYKFGTPVLYQSSFIPKAGSVDTFLTASQDTFPTIFRQIQCDKSLFNEVYFPNDMHLYESDTRLSKLWDGSVGPQDYPNLYHSDGAGSLPGTLSFDMGRVYENLSVVEETGRTCCNNPAEFEIWGIADTTGATPELASNDPGWSNSMQSAGWKLLGQAVRADDGNAAMKFSLDPNPPKVRFIVIRVLKTVNNSSSVNISEFTFWYNQ